MKGVKAYIAGPMTDIPESNFPAFNTAAAKLRSEGWEIYNPAENHGGRTDLPLADYFTLDLPMICTADVIFLLPGWRKSRGVAVELAVARHLNKGVFEYETGESPYDETIDQEAHRIVYGERQAAYGHPSTDFTRTGRIWAAILGIPDIAAEKVGLCMAALKLSREVNMHKRDNLVDVIGYVLTVDRIENEVAA